MDDEHYFIRGCLELPIIDYHENFIWTVWVSLSKESYDEVLEKVGRERQKIVILILGGYL